MQLNVDDFAPASDSEKGKPVRHARKRQLLEGRSAPSAEKPHRHGEPCGADHRADPGVYRAGVFTLTITPLQIRGSENPGPMQYSEAEQAAMAAGEKVFPHILGTDSLGRDYAVRVMMGTRVSLSVGLLASVLVLLIGSVYGSVAGFWAAR